MSAEKKKNVRHVLFMPCTAPSVRTGDLLNEHGQTHRLKSTETIISAIDLLFAERRTFKKIFGTCFGFEKKKKLANAAFTKKKKLFKKKKPRSRLPRSHRGPVIPRVCAQVFIQTLLHRAGGGGKPFTTAKRQNVSDFLGAYFPTNSARRSAPDRINDSPLELGRAL
jgi:hypothetical protein